jgi:hypothetical protein
VGIANFSLDSLLVAGRLLVASGLLWHAPIIAQYHIIFWLVNFLAETFLVDVLFNDGGVF